MEEKLRVELKSIECLYNAFSEVDGFVPHRCHQFIFRDDMRSVAGVIGLILPLHEKFKLFFPENSGTAAGGMVGCASPIVANFRYCASSSQNARVLSASLNPPVRLMHFFCFYQSPVLPPGHKKHCRGHSVPC